MEYGFANQLAQQQYQGQVAAAAAGRDLSSRSGRGVWAVLSGALRDCLMLQPRGAHGHIHPSHLRHV